MARPPGGKEKKENKMERKLTNIRIIHDCYTHVTREGDPNDRWDRDSTEQSHTIRGFEVVEEDRWGDFKVPFEIDPAKEYYLLAVYYDTGDSFGTDGNRIDMIDLYDDIELAMESKRRILENNKNEEGYSVTILNPLGKEYMISASWKGYFENLNDVEIHRVKMKL